MTRILVVGGYGAFGSRVAERLAREGDLEIVIAGRNLEAARACAASLKTKSVARLDVAAVDAMAVSASELRALRPAVIVNASGPFQNHDYTLARASIAAGCHYVDLADGRDYVTGISKLDGEASAANVAVISGASTVPGLSSAVVKSLSSRFESIRGVEIAISPGSGFEPGIAAAAAGLTYLGKPIDVLAGGRVRNVYGWQGLRRLNFPGLGERWTGYCDVPDLDLFPAKYSSLQRIEFRAGLEVGLFQIGLWLLSWPARVGLIRRPERMAGLLTAIKSRLSILGTNRGGMRVAVQGIGRDGKAREEIWSLVGHEGDGLYVPTTAAVILAKKLARGVLDWRGAAACFEHVTLEEFVAEVADLRIATGPKPLYRRVLGDRFDTLPPAVARLHDRIGPSAWEGAARVTHGASPLAKLAAWLMPFPRATEGEEPGFRFSILPDADAEIWSRGFHDRAPRRVFRSYQFERGGRLIETVKGVTFTFRLDADARGMQLNLERLTVAGIPVPRFAHPDIRTNEWDDNGRYRFAVEALLPFGMGLLVRYEGWLAPSSD